MKIRLTRGAYAGLVVEHNDHVAHELIVRGLAERVEPVAAPLVVEVAVVPTPAQVEHAVKKHRRHRA